MTNTTKAALLSGLIFPGLGQFLILKRPKRGALFLLPALAAVAWLMNALSASTSELLTEAASGRLAPDPAAISAHLTESTLGPSADIAALVILACWLASIIDALAIRDKS